MRSRRTTPRLAPPLFLTLFFVLLFLMTVNGDENESGNENEEIDANSEEFSFGYMLRGGNEEEDHSSGVTGQVDAFIGLLNRIFRIKSIENAAVEDNNEPSPLSNVAHEENVDPNPEADPELDQDNVELSSIPIHPDLEPGWSILATPLDTRFTNVYTPTHDACNKPYSMVNGEYSQMRHPNCSGIGYMYKVPFTRFHCFENVTAPPIVCKNVTVVNCTCDNSTQTGENCTNCVNTTMAICGPVSESNSAPCINTTYISCQNITTLNCSCDVNGTVCSCLNITSVVCSNVSSCVAPGPPQVCTNATVLNCTCDNATCTTQTCVNITSLWCRNATAPNMTVCVPMTNYTDTCVCPLDRTGDRCELYRQFNCTTDLVHPVVKCPTKGLGTESDASTADPSVQKLGAIHLACVRPKAEMQEFNFTVTCSWTDTSNLRRGSSNERVPANASVEIPFEYHARRGEDAFAVSCPIESPPYKFRGYNFFKLSDLKYTFEGKLNGPQIAGIAPFTIPIDLRPSVLTTEWRAGGRFYFEVGMLPETIPQFRDSKTRNNTFGGLVADMLLRQFVDSPGWSPDTSRLRVRSVYSAEVIAVTAVVGGLGVFVLMYLVSRFRTSYAAKKKVKSVEELANDKLDEGDVLFAD